LPQKARQMWGTPRQTPDHAGYPHPYFVNKFLVFMGLQAWLRRKIVKTKELSAKSSRIRSYEDDLWDTSLDSHE
jgi:hypothetical protein